MIWTMGEMIVEIMRETEDVTLKEAGRFLGPFPSGAPAIFIDTVAKMGHQAGIIGGVGEDDFGKCILERLISHGVDCSNVLTDAAASTGCAFVTYFADGSRKFIFHIGNTPAAKAKMPEVIPQADYFHIMGCSLMANEDFGREIVKTMHGFRGNGAKISFDPNIRPELLGNGEIIKEVFSVTNVFLPGVSELLSITGKETVEEAIAVCFDNENMEIVALKNGSQGCRIFTREQQFSMGIYPVEAKDATGAGDCFDAAFLCGLCEGKSLTDCARWASAAAALNTAAFGPMEGVITPAIVEEMIGQNGGK